MRPTALDRRYTLLMFLDGSCYARIEIVSADAAPLGIGLLSSFPVPHDGSGALLLFRVRVLPDAEVINDCLWWRPKSDVWLR